MPSKLDEMKEAQLTALSLPAGVLTMDKILETQRKVNEMNKRRTEELVLLRSGSEPFSIEIDKIYVDENNSREDRPTLADRLDKAEERIKQLESDLYTARVLQRCAESEKKTAWKATGEWQDRCNRAEAMAQKLDLVVADLEKCRRDMGERRFKEVVEAK